jgi:hypothetical protein
VMNYLPTQLAVSAETGLVAFVLVALVCAIGLAFGRFVFNKTAREGISEGQ